MSEMIERMMAAFALNAVKREQPEIYGAAASLNALDDVLSADDPESLQTFANLRADLRAALQAMREPTEKMQTAAMHAVDEMYPVDDSAFQIVWEAMIDEALK